MRRQELLAFASRYREELTANVIPFWERHSPDRECGGYYSCLDRDGRVFDRDKFLWMQGREIWCFSHLYRRLSPEPRWLELAGLGAEFVRDNGRAPNGDYWFALDRTGKPLVQPYNIFSDCFCAAGFAEFGRVSGEEWALDLARSAYRRIQERKADPKGVWTKQIGGNRPVKAMALPMIQIWLSGEFEGLLPEAGLEAATEASIKQIMSIHVQPEKRTVFERVFEDGSRPDCMEGRLLCPGHALEALWFVMRAAERRGDRALIERAAEAMLWTVERGWDGRHGGIFYYQDYEGFPTEKLESSMKLWWVHVEALCAFLLAYRLTGSAEHEAWFRRIDEWTWRRFPDPEYGEWYGYLDRSGEPAFGLKGGKWKGFFHLPRALLECASWLSGMAESCAGDGEYRPDFRVDR